MTAFLTFVLHRIEQDSVQLLEHRQDRLAGNRGPAAKDGGHLSTRLIAGPSRRRAASWRLDRPLLAPSCRPITPPFLFCSAISIIITSLSGASLIAMVPDSEWRMPTLIGPVSGAAGAAFACGAKSAIAPRPEAATARLAPSTPSWRRSMVKPLDDIRRFPVCVEAHGGPGVAEQDRGQARRKPALARSSRGALPWYRPLAMGDDECDRECRVAAAVGLRGRLGGNSRRLLATPNHVWRCLFSKHSCAASSATIRRMRRSRGAGGVAALSCCKPSSTSSKDLR